MMWPHPVPDEDGYIVVQNRWGLTDIDCYLKMDSNGFTCKGKQFVQCKGNQHLT